MANCPHCGQLIQVWRGVRLPKKQMRLAEMLEKAGQEGLSREAIAARMTINQVKVYVFQLNEMLVGTDWHVEYYDGHYRINRKNE